MTHALAYFLQLTDRAGEPILLKGNEVSAVSFETHVQGEGPGVRRSERYTRVDMIEGTWYLVRESVQDVAKQLEAMELDE